MKPVIFRKSASALVLILLGSCVINMDRNPESILNVWRNSPEDARSMRAELIGNGFEINGVSDRLQVLSNGRGCQFNLFFNEEKRLTSYQRLSSKEVCIYSVKVRLSPQ